MVIFQSNREEEFKMNDLEIAEVLRRENDNYRRLED
jgi:hypothetical protein